MVLLGPPHPWSHHARRSNTGQAHQRRHILLGITAPAAGNPPHTRAPAWEEALDVMIGAAAGRDRPPNRVASGFTGARPPRPPAGARLGTRFDCRGRAASLSRDRPGGAAGQRHGPLREIAVGRRPPRRQGRDSPRPFTGTWADEPRSRGVDTEADRSRVAAFCRFRCTSPETREKA